MLGTQIRIFILMIFQRGKKKHCGRQRLDIWTGLFQLNNHKKGIQLKRKNLNPQKAGKGNGASEKVHLQIGCEKHATDGTWRPAKPILPSQY